MAAKRKPARRPARRKPARRRTGRRKRNPKFSIMPMLMGLAGGTAGAGGNWALNGTELKQLHQGLIELGAGLLTGGVASIWNQVLGAGLAGAGSAVGLADILQAITAAKAAQTTDGLGRMGAGGQKVLRASGIETRLGAVNAPLGGRRSVEMSAVQSFVEAL